MALACLDNALALSWKDYPCFTDATRPIKVQFRYICFVGVTRRVAPT